MQCFTYLQLLKKFQLGVTSPHTHASSRGCPTNLAGGIGSLPCHPCQEVCGYFPKPNNCWRLMLFQADTLSLGLRVIWYYKNIEIRASRCFLSTTRGKYNVLDAWGLSKDLAQVKYAGDLFIKTWPETAMLSGQSRHTVCITNPLSFQLKN